jgi:pimeloyl-ACP methyl ester carboxylesterase
MRFLKTAGLLLFLFSYNMASSQSTSATYVIVHGAWGGGWAFQKVDSLLVATGSQVYRPTLTGQGERAHLASANVGLNTHIMDIVNTILYEDLYNVILVGHSYGGMVVTGVADKIPERISKLIYLDALLPENGESLVTIFDEKFEGLEVTDGFIIPPWVPEGQLPPKDVPHSLKTWTDKISLTNPARLQLPTTYILTVEEGRAPESDDFYSQSVRAKKKGWPLLTLTSDHNAQWSAPNELVEMLKGIARQ